MPTENRSSNTELSKIVTEALVGMVTAVTGMKPPTDEPLPGFVQAPIDRAVTRISGLLAQPAEQHQGEPVALPERMPTGNITEPHHPWAPGVREGWNKCLDEITKLGPLYTRSVQGEPVVPGHRLDALDALVADGDPQSDANVSNANVAELIRAVRTLQVRTITGPAEPGEVERLRGVANGWESK